jgi:hypothetical protein
VLPARALEACGAGDSLDRYLVDMSTPCGAPLTVVAPRYFQINNLRCGSSILRFVLAAQKSVDVFWIREPGPTKAHCSALPNSRQSTSAVQLEVLAGFCYFEDLLELIRARENVGLARAEAGWNVLNGLADPYQSIRRELVSSRY